MAPNLKLLLVAFLMVDVQVVASFSIAPPRFARSCGMVKNKEFSLKPPSTISTRSTKGASSTALEAIPTWALYSLGHIVGGVSGAPIVTRAQKWYKRIPLPSWTPPNYVFSPVWTVSKA